MTYIKKAAIVIIAVVLVFQTGALTVFARASEKNERVITISNINSLLSGDGRNTASTEIRASGLLSDDIVISGNNIKVQNGTYSYKLTLRANGTLTFNNDLEVFYQGINGRYQLDYEIDETDNHIMIVTGNFENIIIASPLLEKFSDRSKRCIHSHISDDNYSYQLVLRTSEGFSFTNTLRFLFDSKPLGYSVNYTYNLLTKKQSLIINGISGFNEGQNRLSLVRARQKQSLGESKR